MTTLRKAACIVLFAAAALAGGTAGEVRAQDGPPPEVRRAIHAVVDMLAGEGDASIRRFIETAMVPDDSRDTAALTARLRAMREEASGLDDDVSAEREPDGILLILAGGGGEARVKLVLEPEGIAELTLVGAGTGPDTGGARLELTPETIAETFDRLEREGLSGVVHVRLDDEVVLERAFGAANPALGVPMRLDTVFGIGSCPIDFTAAAVLLLDQWGRIDLDDTIDAHFDGVPPDKRRMTIRHLMTGRSGLPDFFHTPDDWDPDLAWVDRETAVRRMLGGPLRFVPGEEEAHAHAAFVLLAALVERASGTSYPAFIEEHLLGPAGMTRTGFYGRSMGLSVRDFAAGRGPSSIGVPNIPPNWGPTSWLVMGSGGMCSTLEDLLRFYRFVRSGELLDEAHAARYREVFANVDGSDRGFERFHAYNPPGNEAMLMLNMSDTHDGVRQLMGAIGRLVEPER